MCDVVAHRRLRDFFGFSRAKHAVVEAAILATRTQFLDGDDVLAHFERLRPLVAKTGGPAEQRAFDYLAAYVAEQYETRAVQADAHDE